MDKEFKDGGVEAGKESTIIGTYYQKKEEAKKAAAIIDNAAPRKEWPIMITIGETFIGGHSTSNTLDYKAEKSI